MAQIGVQAMMLRHLFESDGVFATLERVRELGYRTVEMSQVPMTSANVSELVRARDELGVTVASLSAALTVPAGSAADSLDADFDKIVADSRTLGSRLLRIGMLPIDAMASLDAVLDFCDRANDHAVRLRDAGIALSYHNHHLEFTRYDGTFLLDVIADRAPDLGIELDVHWVHRGGLDPVKTLRRYGDRVSMVHLKDYRIGRIPDAAVALHHQGQTREFDLAFAGLVQFAEVGEGTLDFVSIIEQALANQVDYLFVEQDELYGRTPIQSLRISHDNLVGMGFAGLF